MNNIENIKCLLFDSEKYPAIVARIKNQELDSLGQFEGERKNGFGKYLDIIKFSDQNQRRYVATIYDSNELWQDPQIIDIINLQ